MLSLRRSLAIVLVTLAFDASVALAQDDTTPPTSNVLPLAPSQDATLFNVEWTGSDDDSGIAGYTIFYSEDGSSYSVWLTNTTATIGLFPGSAGRTYFFYSVATDNAGNVEESPSTYDALTGVGGATGVVPPPFLLTWGVFGSGQGEFDQPEAIAVDGDGSVYVSDLVLERIQKFSPSGAFIVEWGSPGTGNSQFQGPSGIAVDDAGSVYVTDYLNHRVQKFTGSGGFLTSWGSAGAFDGQFDRPDGIAVAPNGTVVVADSYNHRIQRFSSNGLFLGAWGTQGSGPGQFHNPAGVAVDADGNVYVSDANNHRIQKFASDGSFLMEWGGYGSGPGQFDTPQGIAVDRSDQVYVADYVNHRIQVFHPFGSFVTQWGTFGTGDGQFVTPADVMVDELDRVFVADFGNSRVQKFGRGILTDRAPEAPRSIAFSASPNPAHAVRLAFDLPRPADVELVVFDLHGRRVSTVFQGALPAGRHTRTWSGVTESGVDAGLGVFFYRLRADDIVRTVRGSRIR